MGWTRRLSNTARAALAAASLWVASEVPGSTADSRTVEAMRAMFGGQLSPRPQTNLRWYLRDLERAEWNADNGFLGDMGVLCRTMDRDGVLKGIMSTRAGGLVQLEKRFDGPPEMVGLLAAGGAEARSSFDEMCAPMELEAFVGDFIKGGVAVGELTYVDGRDYPLFTRRLPEFLVFNWTRGIWQFRTVGGLQDITPGDGQWVLLTAGREMPWNNSCWRALGRSYITKDHARHRRDSWQATLANAARIVKNPQGAPDSQRKSFFQKVVDWGVNNVFSLLPGWDVALLESNGKGADSFNESITEQDKEMIFTISGQTVTADGGVGFANADVFDAIKADLIQRDGDALAHCINTQILTVWTVVMFGEERLAESPTVRWNTKPAADQKAEAETWSATAKAITETREALAPFGLEPDVEAMCMKAGIPVRKITAKPAEATEPANDTKREPESHAFARRLRAVQARNRIQVAA